MATAASAPPRFAVAIPVLFVRDVALAAEFYVAKLGFAVDYLYGTPPFYGAVTRDAACLHLRHVGQPNFVDLAAREPSLIVASIETSDVVAVHAEVSGRGAEIVDPLTRHDWGGHAFQVRDLDGNRLSFVEFDAD